jgi:hypothetical protein
MTSIAYERTTRTDDYVGETFLLGRFGGAVCALYMIVEVRGGVTRAIRVERKSVRNRDGSYSSVITPCE